MRTTRTTSRTRAKPAARRLTAAEAALIKLGIEPIFPLPPQIESLPGQLAIPGMDDEEAARGRRAFRLVAGRGRSDEARGQGLLF